MKNKKLFISFVYIMAFALFLGFTFACEAADKDIVATLNGTNITLDEFKEAVRYKRFSTLQEYQYIAYLYSMYNMPLDESLTTKYETILSEDGKVDLGQKTIDQLVYNIILDTESKKAGISVTDDEVNESLKQMFGITEESAADQTESTGDTLLDSNSSDMTPPEPEISQEAKLQTAMDEYFTATVGDLFSQDFFTNQIYYSLLESKLLDETVFANHVFEAEMVSARHILVETEEIAKEVLEKLNSGEKWDDLAAAYSKDSSNKDKGGNLGWFARGMMVKPFEDAAFSLKKGEISEPIKTDFGYHIIASDGKEIRPLEDDALNNAKNELYKTWYEKVNSEYKPETFDIWKDNIPMEPVFKPIEQPKAEASEVPAEESAPETSPESTPVAETKQP